MIKNGKRKIGFVHCVVDYENFPQMYPRDNYD